MDGRTESDAYEPTMQYAQVGPKMESALRANINHKNTT